MCFHMKQGYFVPIWTLPSVANQKGFCRYNDMMVSFVRAQIEHTHTGEYTSDINTPVTGETFGCYCLAWNSYSSGAEENLGAIKEFTSR